jgi:hypothetical protein
MRIIFLWLCLCNISAADMELIADKTNGTIVVNNTLTKHKDTYAALFGKVHSNVLDMNNYDHPVKFNNITPAGTFTLKKVFSWRLNSDILVFIQGKSSIAAIHPLWTKNKDQRRLQRLLSPEPTDNRITSGCINVLPAVFSVLAQLPPDTKLTILPE